jgi:hypothetical protein
MIGFFALAVTFTRVADAARVARRYGAMRSYHKAAGVCLGLSAGALAAGATVALHDLIRT